MDARNGSPVRPKFASPLSERSRSGYALDSAQHAFRRRSPHSLDQLDFLAHHLDCVGALPYQSCSIPPIRRFPDTPSRLTSVL